MTDTRSFADLSPAMRAALEGRGFTALTPVQEAVLDPALAGRDLRILSQTGSGKTVAVGLAIAADLEQAASPENPPVSGLVVMGPQAAPNPGPALPGYRPAAARPFALVIAPTRELAAQIGRELAWLYQPLGVKVAAVTGGVSYGRELAALREGPLVIVGTPGRMLDHLGRGSIDPGSIGVVVLDEADQMLDLGFRDELDAILEKMPSPRRTLLLSATFPREVQRLADRCQTDPVVAAGASAGRANVDITHVAHLVLPHERDKALVNLLLMAPGERALVFVRTRDGASDLADRLSDAGLPARALHGDLDQRDRTRTLDAFRAGAVTTLVATDVAARGIDVPDVGRVIHADPPADAEVFTHRSGRTGRAGKKGVSVILVPPAMRERARSLLRRAGVEASWSPAPSAADVHRAADDRLVAEIASARDAGGEIDPRIAALADRLLETIAPRDLVAALLDRTRASGPCAPSEVTPLAIAPERPQQPRAAAPRAAAPRARGGAPSDAFVPFRINWGERHGADPRRLLALVCRRGGIRGNEVGAIRIGPTHSTFEVASPVASGFARAVKKPDARDPKIRIDPASPEPHANGPREDRASERPRAPREVNGAARPRAPREVHAADRPRPMPEARGAAPKRRSHWAG